MSDSITRQVLGQKVALGDLYNAYKDVVIADRNIFDSGLSEDQISVEEETVKTFTTALTDSKHDKFAALGVSAETGASVAAGTCVPRGASAFISNVSGSNKIQQVSAICTIKTKMQTLTLDDPDELKDLVNLQNLESESDNATHVVVGVQQGARLAVTLQSKKVSTNNTAQELQRLVSGIERGFTAEETDDDDVSPDADLTALAASYDVKANVDFTIKGIKTATYADMCKYAAKFASSNDKANMPLLLQLMPVKEFVDLVQLQDDVSFKLASFEAVEEKSLAQIVEIVDKVGAAKKTRNDLEADFKAHTDCVPKSQMDKLFTGASLKTYEEGCTTEIKNALVKARGGIKSTLRKILDVYVSGGKATSNLNANLKPWADKIAVLAEATAAGARVVPIQSLTANPQTPAEAGQTRSDLLTGDVYVLYVSADATAHSAWNDNKRKAFDILSNEQAVKMVIVDLDMEDAAAASKVAAPCIQLRRNGKTAIENIVADGRELEEKCLIRCSKTSQPVQGSKTSVVLEKRLPVVMACPHENCSKTSNSSNTWMCPGCKEQITFGFVKDEEHCSFYCTCGSYDIGLAEFRCNDKVAHGTEFVPFPTAAGEDAAAARSRFCDQLVQMKPFEQYNILIMGATGAGKSTFINAFINYLLYDTLQDALNAEQLTFAIPGSFSVPDPKIADRKIEVQWGSENPTESMSGQGQSATQSCVIYAININGKLLRLVDTPGLGDTRGIDQDYKNVADIMRILESLNTISAILFVIKNNDSRLTTSFDFVLSELMMHLHKDTVKNIMFGFTYGRTSIPPFAVGTVGQPLVQLLTKKKLPIQKLITDQNAFVFDAEGFLYAAAWQQNGIRMENKMDTISDSWRISAEKSRLLINVTMKLPVHDTGETLSLERNRRLVDGMSITMVNMAQAITKTKADLNIRLNEIAKLEAEGKELGKEQLQYPRTSIVDEQLQNPRTVCKGEGCAAMRMDPSTKMETLVFEKSCHDECSINTPEAKFGVSELGACYCFAAEGSDCNVCNHPFTSHCHISYRQNFTTVIISNDDAKGKIKKHDEEKHDAEAWKLKLKADQDQLELEENMVRETMAKFSIYLGANSVTAYNDGVVEHLKYLIETAKTNGEEEQYKKYAAQKTAYEALIKKRQQEISHNKDKVPTNQDIQQLLEKLKQMDIYGKDFIALLDRKDAQVPYQSAVPVKVSKSGGWNRLGKWIGRQW